MLVGMASPRILAGSAKGRPLKVPPRGTRPSPSRLREALFDIIAFEPRGRFLDLYAGSGAMGLEAASRGWDAVCVDLARQAAAVIRDNARDLGLQVEVLAGDAVAYARAHPAEFDVLVAAPPYPDDLRSVFAALLASGAVRPNGLYVLQHPSEMASPALPAALAGAEVRRKRYGTNTLTLVRVPV
jgi:16S rRNA (guanine(966)-N(2))-methyltransferase RsmD